MWQKIENSTFVYTLSNEAFNNKSNLNTHVKQVHNNEKSFSCMHCGKAFFRRDWQIDHELRKHSNKKLQIKEKARLYKSG